MSTKPSQIHHIERLPDGTRVRLTGMVICRQRPQTAKGVRFMLLEDEFGLSNVVVHSSLYERERRTIRGEPFIMVSGVLQRRGPTINVLARTVSVLRAPGELIAPGAHDFH